MEVKIGVSNRHVHLKQEHLDILFGLNFSLTKDRDLVQPGNFASASHVTILTIKDEINNVRVLGPLRSYTQVEISKTDAYKLGLNPPIRTSGDIAGSSPITIVGPQGIVELKEGCIIPNRHIHLTSADALNLGLNPNKQLKVKVSGIKGGILDNVHLKINDDYVLEMHLDTDDANANLIKTGDLATIIKEENNG